VVTCYLALVHGNREPFGRIVHPVKVRVTTDWDLKGGAGTTRAGEAYQTAVGLWPSIINRNHNEK